MKINNINGVQRYVVVFVTFLGVIMIFLTRHSLNLAMTKLNPPKLKPLSFEETYEWDSKVESVIHAAFYIGYVPGHAPGAFFAEKFGGKFALNVCLFITAILTALTPIAVRFGDAVGLITIRVFMGVIAGTAFPSVGNILSSWVPKKERAISSAFVLGGVQLGSMLSSLLAGEILQATAGYANVFFAIGGVCLAWNVLFFFTVSSRPDNHPRISDEEKEYLSRELGELSEKRKKQTIPWSSLLTSKPVWALIIAQLGHDWAIFFIASYIPKYLKGILKMDFQKAGRFFALSYFIAYLFSIFCGYLGGYLIQRKITTITMSRKLFTFLCKPKSVCCRTLKLVIAALPQTYSFAATIVPGAILVVAAYVEPDWATALIILCNSLMGAFYAGNRVNVLDICPNYTASLLGLVNGIGAIAGIVAIFSTGVLTPKQTQDEWRTVFWITFIALFVTTVVYLLWASGEKQSWNDDPDEDNCLKKLFARETKKGITTEPNNVTETERKAVNETESGI